MSAPAVSFRHVVKLHSGGQISFRGTYLEVTPPKRLVYTSIFEPRPEAGEVLCTVTFEELEGKTKIVLHEKFPSKEALQAAMKSGMDASLEQLEELVASLVASNAFRARTGGIPVIALNTRVMWL